MPLVIPVYLCYLHCLPNRVQLMAAIPWEFNLRAFPTVTQSNRFYSPHFLCSNLCTFRQTNNNFVMKRSNEWYQSNERKKRKSRRKISFVPKRISWLHQNRHQCGFFLCWLLKFFNFVKMCTCNKAWLQQSSCKTISSSLYCMKCKR